MRWSAALFLIATSVTALPQAPPPAPAESRVVVDPLEASASAAIASASLKPYVKPLVADEIHEWGAYGDSFTAGIGSNGLEDYDGHSNACSRYKKAYPWQINGDSRLPGDPAKRKLNFGACSGNKMEDMRAKQLTDSSPADYNNFGKPQIAVVTIGGNDLDFESAINSCIIRAHGWPAIPDCGEVLSKIERTIEDLRFQGSLDETLLATVVKGRVNSGANPPESFQLFVNGYVPFWNEDDPGCDEVSWVWWRRPTDHFLTRSLRKRMNDIVKAFNFQIKRATFRLANEGVFYVEGFQDAYRSHQYCDPEADSDLRNPISSKTWFWASNSPWNGGEGPASASNYKLQDAILNALVPDSEHRASITTQDKPPSDFNDAFKSKEAFEAALDNLRNSTDPEVNVLPEAWRRIFHPKGSAYTAHKDANINAILVSRNPQPNNAAPPPTSPPPKPEPSNICGSWYKLVLDHFEIRGKDFDEAKFGKDGAGLKKEVEGCGELTKWKFEYTPNDPRFAWFARGQLPIGTKACVGRAVVSAGGKGPDGCKGSG